MCAAASGERLHPRILTVPIESGVPASISGLIQGAVAAGIGGNGFDDVRIKDLGRIVLESPAALQEHQGEQETGEVESCGGEHG